MARMGMPLKGLQKAFFFHNQNHESHKDHLQISDQLFCYPYCGKLYDIREYKKRKTDYHSHKHHIEQEEVQKIMYLTVKY